MEVEIDLIKLTVYKWGRNFVARFMPVQIENLTLIFKEITSRISLEFVVKIH